MIQPITALQIAMITRLVQNQLGFKPEAFPATYQAAERLIWALTPSADQAKTRPINAY